MERTQCVVWIVILNESVPMWAEKGGVFRSGYLEAYSCPSSLADSRRNMYIPSQGVWACMYKVLYILTHLTRKGIQEHFHLLLTQLLHMQNSSYFFPFRESMEMSSK